MEIKVLVPEYTPSSGVTYNWEKGFELEVKIENNTVVILANKAGLLSLANHLLNLSQDVIPVGYHMHFDENNSLEENSNELILQKK